VSKPPAKTAKKAAAKTAAKAAPAPKAVKKPAAKPPAKAASKKPAKAPAKKAAKTAAKAHAKPPVKAAAKAPAKVAAKPTPTKPVAKPAPTKPATKATPATPGKPAAKTAAAPPHKTTTDKASKVTPAAKTPTAAVAPAAPVPSRFSDRFGPAKVTAPTHHVPMDPVKSAAKLDPKLANAWKSKAGRDLSEPELLAMPDSEYMNDKQIDYFRAVLQAQKDDLLSNAGETTEHLREDTSIVPDPADRATIEEEHALELRTRDRERKLLKKISQALGRLDNGEYGFCDETGEPIGLARLLARPTATLSLEAQQRRELKQKMFGD
jgi:DnaK suppressor protein